jgi:hypothetical protein
VRSFREGGDRKNILTIDVEDWYMDTDISTWDSYEDRVVKSTQKVLEILDECAEQNS